MALPSSMAVTTAPFPAAVAQLVSPGWGHGMSLKSSFSPLKPPKVASTSGKAFQPPCCLLGLFWQSLRALGFEEELVGSVSQGQAQAVLGGDGHPRRGQAALLHLAQAVGALGALQERHIFT